MLDKILFLKAMTAISEIYDKKLSDDALDVYFSCLEEISDDDFIFATNRIAKERTFQSMPKPAEFLEKILGSLDDRAVFAWEIAYSTAISTGIYKSVSFQDSAIHSVIEALGGWEFFASHPKEETPYIRKNFIDFYKALSKRDYHPEFLLGFLDQKNGCLQNLKQIECGYVPKKDKKINYTQQNGLKNELAETVGSLADRMKPT